MGKTCLAHPQDRVKLFLKSGNCLRPPFKMALTSSYQVKPTPKLFLCPPSAWLKLFRPPPPFKEWKLFASRPPLQNGFNFKLPGNTYPETFCAPLQHGYNFFRPPPPFHRGKTSHGPPSCFVAPPPPRSQ